MQNEKTRKKTEVKDLLLQFLNQKQKKKRQTFIHFRLKIKTLNIINEEQQYLCCS